MRRIVLSTSSSGLDNLPLDNKVELIRLRIFINNVEFIDGKNISNGHLQNLLKEVGQSPAYTLPAPINEVAELLTRLQQAGYEEVFITTSSKKMCGSYDIICKAAEQFKHNMSITVYDCQDVGGCEAMLALEAQHLLATGASVSEVITRLDTLRSSYQMLFAVDDLKGFNRHFKQSSQNVKNGFLDNLLQVKPIMQTTQNGGIVLVHKVRNIEEAFEYITYELGDIVQRVDSFACVLSNGKPQLDQRFIKVIKERTGISRIAISPPPTVSMVNFGSTGTGLGVFYGEIPYAAKFYNLV